MRPKVYISGAITLGDPVQNFATFCSVFHQLVRIGMSPFNPGLTMLLPGQDKIDHATWIEVDLPWVGAADVVLRLPGASTGADQEVEYAKAVGVPVVDSYHKLLQWKSEWHTKHSP